MDLHSWNERRRDGVRQDWFEIEALEPDLWAITEPFHDECVRSHLVIGASHALLIDAGMGVGDLRAVVDELTNLPVTLVNSHAHWDHIGANHQFGEIAIHQAEAKELAKGYPNARLRSKFAPEHLSGPLPPGFDIETVSIPPSAPSITLSGGERFDLGGRELEVINAPGHSPGGIVLLDRGTGVLFSTDVAYAGALYAFGPDANFADYRRTLAALAALAPSLNAVFPSHNAARIEPAMLVALRDGIGAIAAGRQPDTVRDGVNVHQFQGFSILTDANAPSAGGR